MLTQTYKRITENSSQENSIWARSYCPLRQKYGTFPIVLMINAAIWIVVATVCFSQYTCSFPIEKLFNTTTSVITTNYTTTAASTIYNSTSLLSNISAGFVTGGFQNVSSLISNITLTTPTILTNLTSAITTLPSLSHPTCCFNVTKLYIGPTVFCLSYILFCTMMFISTKTKNTYPKNRENKGLGNQYGFIINVIQTNQQSTLSLCSTIRTLRVKTNICMLCTMIFLVFANITTLYSMSSECLSSSCIEVGIESILQGTVSSVIFISILAFITLMYIFGSVHLPKKNPSRNEVIEMNSLTSINME